VKLTSLDGARRGPALARFLYSKTGERCEPCRASYQPPAVGQKTDFNFAIEGRNVRSGIGGRDARIYQKDHSVLPQVWEFRPRLVTIDGAISLAEALTLSANEDAISLNPAFISHLNIPNVVMVPIADAGATWDLFVVWQRGKAAGPLRALLDALPDKARRQGTS
jgi:DNA-binding transcriptional LysR family regulator